MKHHPILFICCLVLSACATKQTPPEPDRSNIKPINNDASIVLIREKLGLPVSVVGGLQP